MSDPMAFLQLPHETQAQLGERLKRLRLDLGFKRTTLAERAGVSARSLQRFESTGEISLKSLLRLVHAVGRLPEFSSLLQPAPIRSLGQVGDPAERERPKRGWI